MLCWFDVSLFTMILMIMTMILMRKTLFTIILMMLILMILSIDATRISTIEFGVVASMRGCSQC